MLGMNSTNAANTGLSVVQFGATMACLLGSYQGIGVFSSSQTILSWYQERLWQGSFIINAISQ